MNVEPTELPIACSLSTTDLRARLAEMAELGRCALTGSDCQGRRAELRFDGSARERVEAIAAAEAECCAFLEMRVSEEDGEVLWALEAPAGAEAVLEELVAAFRG
jgi:hypothetical protein